MADMAIFWMSLGAKLAVMYYLMRWLKDVLKDVLDPTANTFEQNSSSLQRLEVLLKRRDPNAILPTLTEYEMTLAQDIVDPDGMEVTFADIGGIDHIKQQIWELAVLPLKEPDLFAASQLTQSPKGILLYGKPGTGKTMLAKAIAKEAGAIFIALKLSKIMDKWVGESQKWVAAAFGLARKVAPSIIFIDEIDTFLNPRGSFSEDNGTASLKSEFLTFWDGISTSDNSGVLVLGATNRPHHVDTAILRRLPRMFEVPLPDQQGRFQILKLILQKEYMNEEAREYLPQLAQVTVNYSGSDLKELCRAAAFEPIRDAIADISRRAVMGESPTSGKEEKPKVKRMLRPMSVTDLEEARNKVKATGTDALDYGKRLQAELRL